MLVDAASDLAADAGIEPGDIVVSVNGKPVASREALAALVAASPKVAALLIVRDNTRTFVSLKSR